MPKVAATGFQKQKRPSTILEAIVKIWSSQECIRTFPDQNVLAVWEQFLRSILHTNCKFKHITATFFLITQFRFSNFLFLLDTKVGKLFRNSTYNMGDGWMMKRIHINFADNLIITGIFFIYVLACFVSRSCRQIYLKFWRLQNVGM